MMAAETAAETAEQPTEPTNDKLQWFAVHTYSGYENRVKKTLEERIKQASLEEGFGEILIPMETVEEVRGGNRRTSKRKFFPGYILVQMEMTKETWHLVKETAKVTGFVGDPNKGDPKLIPAVKEREVKNLTQQITEGISKPTPKVEFDEGDQVRVIDGPFANFNGSIEEVKPEKQKKLG
jgi:transcriptional antiterminator NusG